MSFYHVRDHENKGTWSFLTTGPKIFKVYKLYAVHYILLTIVSQGSIKSINYIVVSTVS